MGIMLPPVDLRAAFNSRRPIWERAPGSRDDVTRGYAQGDSWREGNRLWVCYRADQGKSAWAPHRFSISAQPAGAPLPADVVPDCIAAYGTMLLTKSWEGSLLNVERASDAAAADIGRVGNDIDKDAVRAHAPNSEVRIATAYEQMGSGHHATATGASRPYLPKAPVLGDRLGMAFVNNYSGIQSNSNIQYLSLPNTLTVNSRSHTIIAYFKPAHSHREMRLLWFTRQDDGSDYYVGTGYGCMITRGSSTNRNGTLDGIPIEPMPYIWDSGSTSLNMRCYTPRRRVDNFFAPPAATLVAKTIGGGAGGSSKMRGHLGALLIYNRQLTEAEILSVVASLNIHFGGRPQLRGMVVPDGDSIIEGPDEPYLMSGPDAWRYTTRSSALFYNCGISGSSWRTQRTDHLSKWLPMMAQSAPYKYLIANMGTNSVGSGDSAATILSDQQAYFDAVKSGVSWSRILMSTMLPRGLFNDNPSTYGAVAAAADNNTRLYHRSWGADLIDWADDPTWGDPTAVDNLLIMTDGDRTHPDGMGYMIQRQPIGDWIETTQSVWG